MEREGDQAGATGAEAPGPRFCVHSFKHTSLALPAVWKRHSRRGLGTRRQQGDGLALVTWFFREKLLRRAPRIGAGLLEQAATCNGNPVRLRRAMRAVTFAMAIKNVRGDPAFALQSFNQKARLFSLVAIAAAQKRPLVKAALFSADVDDFSRVALLCAHRKKEPRLIAAVDHLAWRLAQRSGPSGLRGTKPTAAKSHN